MRVLVTGVKGQLGHDVMDELAAKGIEGIGVDVEEMDITDAAACEKVLFQVLLYCDLAFVLGQTIYI